MGQLNVIINATDLENLLNTGAMIGLTNAATPGLPLLWAAVTPTGFNILTWPQMYALYSSPIQLTGASSIQILDACFASPGIAFYVDDTGMIHEQLGIDHNNYQIANWGQQPYTVGMALSMQGPITPINAATIAPGQTIEFAPQDEVSVFITNDVTQGLVLQTLPAGALTINYNNATEIFVTYNAATGGFVVGGG
jgi:hypothetical protein